MGRVPYPKPVVGAHEIAAMLGVTRQRVQQLSHTAGFPAPVYRLRMGSIWRLADVEAWAERTSRDLRRDPDS